MNHARARVGLPRRAKLPSLADISRLAQRWRVAMARTPQWWVWVISGLSWLWLLGRAGIGWDSNRAMQDICRAPQALNSAASLLAAMAGGFGGWCLMVTAMMFPLLGEAVANTAFATPCYRRQRAIAIFLVGYLALWLMMGAAVRAAVIGLNLLLPVKDNTLAHVLPVIGFGVAAMWVWLPARRRAQLNCGRTIPLRLSGWRAESDCLRYGVIMGWACVRTCWAPMAALMLASHGLGMMALVAGLLAYERFFLPHKSKLLGYAWAGIALALLVQALR